MAARWLDTHMVEVLKGAATAFPLRAVGAGLGFALNLVLARLLGADDVGIYYLALTVSMMASAIATLGLGNVLVRHTAANAERGDFTELRAIARTGTRLSLACAIGLTLLLATAAPWICENLLGKAELTRPLQWMALTIVPQTQMRLHAQLLRGLKKIALSQMLRNVDVPFFTLVFIAMLGGSYGATGAVWCFVTANLITAVVAAWLWQRAAGSGDVGQSPIGVRALLRSGIPILQSELLLVNAVTMLMLGAINAPAAVAIYGVAFQTAKPMRYIMMAVNSIAGPKFAALHGMGEGNALNRTARGSALLMTVVAVPMLLVLILFPEWIMGLFGSEFVAGAGVLRILAITQFIAVMSGSIGSLLVMSGHERLLRNNSAAAFVMAILLNLVLIPEFGAMGAAISAAAAIVLRNGLGMLQVYRRLGILPFFVSAPGNGGEEE